MYRILTAILLSSSLMSQIKVGDDAPTFFVRDLAEAMALAIQERETKADVVTAPVINNTINVTGKPTDADLKEIEKGLNMPALEIVLSGWLNILE